MNDVRIDERRLVETACELVAIPSPTGREKRVARHLRGVLEDLGLSVLWQEVERGRPNVVGTVEGAGGGPMLMLNGHMDTSYSGREATVRGKRGFSTEPVVDGGRIYGLGVANMKGALACYVEAVRALHDAGVRLRGTVVLAAVVGEIEKTQWGDQFVGAEYRGYAAGSRHLVAHGGVADMCLLGEPTQGRIVLGHCGSLWGRISTSGPFVHSAFSDGRLDENSIMRMREVVDAVREWIPTWAERAAYGGRPGVVNVGAISGGFPWRVSRTPARTDLFLDVRVPPTMPMAEAAEGFRELARGLRERFPDYGVESEIYVTAPGSEIAPDHPLVAAIDESHREVFGATPERDTVRWFSDASVLTRYGIETVNYGAGNALPGEEGESMAVDELAATARVYALTAMRVCGVA